jgi:hypothetical protein
VLLFGMGIGAAEMNAQIGGFLKRTAKDVAQPDSGNAKTTEPPANNQSPHFNENVLELNAENLAKLEKALTCEKGLRDGVEAKYSKLPTKEQYQNCMMQVMMSPEAQSIAQSKSTDMMAQMKQLMALQENKCGKDPEKAQSGKNDELRGLKDQGAKCGGLTRTQYAIATERIAPFCNSGGQEKVKSSGNLHYVYSPAEVSAIKPKCATLTALISDLNEPPKKK